LGAEFPLVRKYVPPLAPRAAFDNTEQVMPVLAKLYVVSGDEFQVILGLPCEPGTDLGGLGVLQFLELLR
jgi:hypothetical protein